MRVLSTVVVTIAIVAPTPALLEAERPEMAAGPLCFAGSAGVGMEKAVPDKVEGAGGRVEIAISIGEGLDYGQYQYCEFGCESHFDCFELCPEAGYATRCYKEPGIAGPGHCVIL